MKRAALFALLLSAAAAAAIDWREVASVRIPEGEAASVAVDGETVWKKPNPLPYDAEIEYLESTGTQFIDTGVYDAEPYEFFLRFSLAADNVNNNSLFGTFINGRRMVFMTKLANGKNRLQGSHGAVGNNFTFFDAVNDTIYTLRVHQAGSYWYEVNGGARVNKSFGDDLSTANGTLYVMSRHGNSQPIKGKLFACKIWDNNGVLVRDFQPVRAGATGYLYDRVSGQLYGNAGTGAFVLGPDKE